MANRSLYIVFAVVCSLSAGMGCLASPYEHADEFVAATGQEQKASPWGESATPKRAHEPVQRGLEEEVERSSEEAEDEGALPEDAGVFPLSAQAAQALAELAQLVVSEPPANIPAYDRDDWPHWRDSDKDCQNTRAEVLIEESSVLATFATASNCRVVGGSWTDPYTGEQFDDASELDVDHVVPLKNAHLSGGWSWSRDEKTAFANDLKDSGHLMAVKASANRQKGARGPEEWQPPLVSYHCDYASTWIHIKWRYQLDVTANERDALTGMLASCI